MSADAAADVTVNLYDRLFMVENPSNEVGVTDFTENLNPNSMEVLENAKIDRSLLGTKAGTTFQFMRQGYFSVDAASTEEHLVFNRTVALKDSWSKK